VPRTSEREKLHTPERMIPYPEVRVCPACGRENPASHKFCGSCGSDLNNPAERATDTEERRADEEAESKPDPQPFEHSISDPNELSLFRSFRPSGSEEDGYWEEEPRSPYRIYFGIIIALLIGGLAYMAWRTSKSGAQSAHEIPPVPAATEKAPGPAAAPANTPEASSPKAAEPAANPPAAAVPKKAEPAETTPRVEPKDTPVKAAAEPAHAQAPPDNGSTELSEARRYLEAKDGADAEKWLWKSVAKHNGEATVLLADLYLKGEGVSKNCDQARVLLDSAARKGVAGAGERLRNLPAFGCQ
jgi:hypothetical protein